MLHTHAHLVWTCQAWNWYGIVEFHLRLPFYSIPFLVQMLSLAFSTHSLLKVPNSRIINSNALFESAHLLLGLTCCFMSSFPCWCCSSNRRPNCSSCLCCCPEQAVLGAVAALPTPAVCGCSCGHFSIPLLTPIVALVWASSYKVPASQRPHSCGVTQKVGSSVTARGYKRRFIGRC